MSANEDDLAAFRDNFRLDELKVDESDGWVLSVRPGQLTLASMVVSASGGEQWFNDLATGQDSGFFAMVASAERLAKQVYGAVRLNVVALMMKDPVVHFHVLPRYDSVVERYGRAWSDEDWPGPPTFGTAATDDAVLHAIRDDLRAAL